MLKKNKKKIFIFALLSILFSCFFSLYSVSEVQAQGEPSMYDVVNGNPYYDPTTGSLTTAQQKTQELLGNNAANTSTSVSSGNYFNQEKIPGAAATNSFVDYLKQIIRFGFAAIGIMALFMLSVGAYQYLMAASNLAKAEKAKETIGSAFLGLILGLTAFLILRTINPQLVSLQLSSPGGGVMTTAPGTTGANVPKFSGAAPEEIKKKVQEYSNKYGISEDLAMRLVGTESNFNPNATSSKGAKGLMQLMDGTANGLGVSNSYDVDQNLNGGMKHLKYLLDKYNGDTSMALAAYNWGEGNLASKGLDSMPKETRNYLCKILGKC